MERVLILLVLFIILQSCQSHTCKNSSEIGFIYNLKNEKDRQSICKAYEANRELFFSLKNHAKNYGITQIEEVFFQSNVHQEAIDQFLEYWQIMAKEHRLKTQERDSVYREGVLCLRETVKKEEIEFNEFIRNNKKIVESSLSTNQIERIRKGVSDYLSFSKKMKRQFLKEETLLYGKLGKNIISYNQLSFDVIEQFMTSQYRFGLKDNYSKQLIECYRDNKNLDQILVKYRKLEKNLVEKLTSDECFKRVGVLRYYDDLDGESKERAIRVNMLMNMLK